MDKFFPKKKKKRIKKSHLKDILYIFILVFNNKIIKYKIILFNFLLINFLSISFLIIIDFL